MSSNVIRFLVLLAFSVFSARAAHAQYFAITGVHTGTAQSGARPARRNILDMQNDTPTWSLYIQALSTMQSMDENDQLSYFQIAGIHGRPYITWNNASEVPGSGWGGYCTHGSILFLTWHRPYLVLVEQLLASHVQAIAQSYNSTIYEAAANNFRLPYWDWASIPAMPDVVSEQYIQITTASGVKTVSNPLYQYKFPSSLNPSYFPASDGPITQDPYTIRDVTSTVNAKLQASGAMAAAYRALTKETSFDGFCTSAAAGLAIENIHDNIHVDIGGGAGHMSFLAYSAFDPIFWLHHTNIDRLFAIWQAIHPNQYLTQMEEGTGTYTIPPGTLDTQYTSLEPFTSNGRDQFYTSASSWKTSTFGYTYPEISDWNQTPAQLKSNVTATISRMYNPQASAKRAASPGIQTKEWSIALNVSRYNLHGARFIIRVFLGQVPQNPEDWPICNSLSGSFSVLPPPHQGNGPYPTIIAYSEISLTKGLTENGVDPTNVKAVEKWLENNLHWGVQKFDLTVVPNEQVPSLHLVVQDEDVTPPGDITELPTYGETTLHPEITQGK
ncbi:Di-copper centre-containing protein [Stipitochalara longipes BDJ]|nr:Di-copper centre-containing protein [Stipitochalara longipes BDJ]